MTWGYQDTIPSVVWWTTIETPALRRRTGIDRRMGYLAFVNEIPDADKDANQFYPQALLDAMVTVGVQQARLWRKREIRDPNVQIPDGVTAVMDPVQQAISDLDPDNWADKPVSMAREHVAIATGDQRITATSFGNAVSVNDVWCKERETVGENRNKWVLKLRGDLRRVAPGLHLVLFSEKNSKKSTRETRHNPAPMKKPKLKEKDDTGKATLEPRLREK